MRILVLIGFFYLSLVANERVVALSPAINEIIYALDEGDSIVANTEYCNYPEESKSKPKVGGYFAPSLEAIVAAKPTIVIMQENNVKIAHDLKRLGIDTLILKITTIEHIKEAIAKIAHLYKKEQKSTKLIAKIDAALDATSQVVEGKKILIVFGVQSDLSKNVFVAGQNLYFNDIIERSGNTNAFYSKRKGQPIIDIEAIIAINPDIIIILAPYLDNSGKEVSEVTKRWLTLPINAAKKGAIYLFDKEYAGIASDRILYFLEDFREVLVDFRDR